MYLLNGLAVSVFAGMMLVASSVEAQVPVPETQAQLDAEFERAIPQKQKGMEVIRQRLIEAARNYASSPKEVAEAKADFDRLNKDGRFTDLLKRSTPERWIKGLDRLKGMAANYARMTSQQQAPLREPLFAAIEYYCRDIVAHPDPFTGAAFTGPRAVATMYFALYDQLQAPQSKDVAQAMKDALFLAWYHPMRGPGAKARRDKPYRAEVFTGSDGQFAMGNLAYRSLVECAVALQDTKLLDTARTVMVRSMDCYTSYQTTNQAFWGELGMTYDGNGFAHGRQSYLFGYVRHWFNGLTRDAGLFEGTPWAIPIDKWDHIAAMMLDGSQWYVYQADVDWSVNGRHNMYPGLIGNGPIDGSEALEQDAASVLDASKGKVKRADELRAMIERVKRNDEFAGCRYFWNTEDLILRDKDFYISVNLSSIRSQGPEVAAPFSVVNYYFPFGSMMIKAKGDEYRRARGAIDYTLLPGITSDPTAPVTTKTNWHGYQSTSSFCGGLSDGKIGVAGMISQDKSPVSSHKGYFAWDEGMVMLGAAITTGNAETVVKQAEWRDDVSFG
jgi:hypothetical protein